MLESKRVYLNRENIGEARSWNEVFALLDDRGILRSDFPYQSEGPDGFYLFKAMSRPDLLAFGKAVTA